MSSTLVQIRLDDELKTEATALYGALGLDLPTAIRMFLRRSVMENGIPFSMTLPTGGYRATDAVRAMHSLSEQARTNGTADMSLEEINAEIAKTRAEMRTTGGT